jgi:competence protein ComEA
MKYFSIRQQWVLFVIALLLLGILYLKFYCQPQPIPSEESAKEIVVEVSGEVRQPGIYLFQDSPNLGEAIQRAGGLKETAQFDATSSSIILETGTLLTAVKESSRIHHSPPHPFLLPPAEREIREGPLLKEQPQKMTHEEIRIRIGRMAANKLLVFSIPLDLNLVSLEDLCLVPGIGESLGREILAYRQRRKGFRSVEELRNVRGIGGKKYEIFKKLFAVNPVRNSSRCDSKPSGALNPAVEQRGTISNGVKR